MLPAASVTSSCRVSRLSSCAGFVVRSHVRGPTTVRVGKCRARTACAAPACGGGAGSNGIVNKWTSYSGDGDDEGRSDGGLACTPSGGLLAAAALLANGLLLAGPAHAKRSKKEPVLTSKEIDAFTDKLWQLSGPIMQNLGFSGIIGVCAAAALKVVGRALAVAVGLIFVLVQGLAYKGYISVNWAEIHKEVNKTLDVNRDGRLDEGDFKIVVQHAMGALSQGVPSVGGFLSGFWLGLKCF